MNHLRLTANFDDDGTLELHIQAEANGFSGQGSAWFTPSHLMAFASQLEAYPLPRNTATILVGGYGHSETEGIDQEHLFLSFYPIESRGTIGVGVRLATPLGQQERPESRHAVQLEMRTTYHDLGLFAKDVRRLVLAEASEADLTLAQD